MNNNYSKLLAFALAVLAVINVGAFVMYGSSCSSDTCKCGCECTEEQNCLDTIAELEAIISAGDASKSESESEIAEQEDKIAEQEAIITAQEDKIAEHEQTIADYEKTVEELEKTVEELEEKIEAYTKPKPGSSNNNNSNSGDNLGAWTDGWD